MSWKGQQHLGRARGIGVLGVGGEGDMAGTGDRDGSTGATLVSAKFDLEGG